MLRLVKLAFTAEDVIRMHKDGEKDIILVRLETSPEDIEGMNLAHGVLTLRGGMTSHAAVVARGMGTCCVSGCGDLVIDEEKKTLALKDGRILKEGDYYTYIYLLVRFMQNKLKLWMLVLQEILKPLWNGQMNTEL